MLPFLVVGFHFRRRFLLLWSIVIFSVVAILSQVTYLVIWAVKQTSWSISDVWWAKLIGFMTWDWFLFLLFSNSSFLLVYWFVVFGVCFCRIQSWKYPYVIYFLVIQLLALLVALFDIYGKRHFLNTWQDSRWGHFLSIVEHLGL